MFFRPSYVVPYNIVHGIKERHPMFKGYTQQVSESYYILKKIEPAAVKSKHFF